MRCPDCRAAKKAARNDGYGDSYSGGAVVLQHRE